VAFSIVILLPEKAAFVRYLQVWWIGLDWIGLDWIGLDWIGLD